MSQFLLARGLRLVHSEYGLLLLDDREIHCWEHGKVLCMSTSKWLN